MDKKKKKNRKTSQPVYVGKRKQEGKERKEVKNGR